MSYIGLAFDNESGKIYKDSSEVKDYSTLDGCFRFSDEKNVVSDSNGFLPTYVDVETHSIVDNKNYIFYEHPYIEVPDNCIFELENLSLKYYACPKNIEDIFGHFEDWFAMMYQSMKNEFSKIFLSVTMGLDSRYLMAILKSRDIQYKAVSWGHEGTLINNILPEVEPVNIMRNRLKYMTEYACYYKKCNYTKWSSEYYVYLYYKFLSERNVDVLVEGLGRNFYCNKPRIWNSHDIQKVRTSFSCGRAPIILDNKLKTFYPYSCRNIRYNFRRLNLSETEFCNKLVERMNYLCPELAKLDTTSFEKARDNDAKIEKEYKEFFFDEDRKLFGRK